MSNKEQLLALAEAIREGIELFPKQAYGNFWTDEKSACVLGAAIAIVLPEKYNEHKGFRGCHSRKWENELTYEMIDKFPILDCTFDDPTGQMNPFNLWTTMHWLNDEPNYWTREEIADWIETLAEEME